MSILNWIAGLFRREPTGRDLHEASLTQLDLRTGRKTLVRETDAGKLWAKIATNYCPDCGCEGFYEGPSGGLSTNIICANGECQSRFNVTPMIGIAERI